MRAGLKVQRVDEDRPDRERDHAKRDAVAGIAAEGVRERRAPKRAMLVSETATVGRDRPVGLVEICHASPRNPPAMLPDAA